MGSFVTQPCPRTVTGTYVCELTDVGPVYIHVEGLVLAIVLGREDTNGIYSPLSTTTEPGCTNQSVDRPDPSESN